MLADEFKARVFDRGLSLRLGRFLLKVVVFGLVVGTRGWEGVAGRR